MLRTYKLLCRNSKNYKTNWCFTTLFDKTNFSKRKFWLNLFVSLVFTWFCHGTYRPSFAYAKKIAKFFRTKFCFLGNSVRVSDLLCLEAAKLRKGGPIHLLSDFRSNKGPFLFDKIGNWISMIIVTRYIFML